jgi:hypothetical protein
MRLAYTTDYPITASSVIFYTNIVTFTVSNRSFTVSPTATTVVQPNAIWRHRSASAQPSAAAQFETTRRWRYPMVSVFTTRLNCFPICAEKADDAALTLPISLPLSKSWAPCSVMFWGGFSPSKNSVTHSWAVFCSAVPQLTRFTLE